MTRAAVVPGNHDGVHLGHQALLARARAFAEERSLETVALTFDPHPLAVLAEDRCPLPLTTMARRRELLARHCDRVVIHHFDREYAARSPRGWAQAVLHDELQSAAVVVGPDFKFGNGGSGTLETLHALGEELDFDVAEVSPQIHEKIRVSSTRIRSALLEGEVEAATAMLSRVHEVSGEVVRGQQRGRTIGFPTANLAPEPVLLPRDGVYAVIVRSLEQVERVVWRGVANLGTRPTLQAGRSFEIHLFDLDRDLYGQRLRVGFVARLRDERRFDSLEALRVQIELDAQNARTRLAQEDASWQLL